MKKVIITNMEDECFTKLCLEGIKENTYINQKLNLITEIECDYITEIPINEKTYVRFICGDKSFWLTPKDYESYEIICFKEVK